MDIHVTTRIRGGRAVVTVDTPIMQEVTSRRPPGDYYTKAMAIYATGLRRLAALKGVATKLEKKGSLTNEKKREICGRVDALAAEVSDRFKGLRIEYGLEG